MAQDITEQAEQEAIADTLVAEPEVEEPQEQTAEAEPQQQETQPAEQELQSESEEVAEDWLPDEQSKIFPDEAYSQYAQNRYPELARLLQDRNTPEPTRDQVRQILHDKINSDIYFRHIAQQQAQQETEEQEFVEEPEPHPQPEPTRTQQPEISRDQYFSTLNQAVTQRTDPQVAKDFYTGFVKSFGMNDQQIAETLKANPNAPMEFTRTMSVYALNLINTFADDLIGAKLGQHIEQSFPRFGEMYQISAAARTWDSARSGFENVELPAYGTREYSSEARKIGAEIAGSAERFESMTFTDPRTGQPLNHWDNISEKQRMIAERMATSRQQPQAPVVPPALVAQAVKTGQKIQQRQTAKQQAGSLGSGKSRAQIAGQTNGDIFEEGLALYQREHGSL